MSSTMEHGMLRWMRMGRTSRNVVCSGKGVKVSPHGAKKFDTECSVQRQIVMALHNTVCLTF